eukprot:g1862.t1
MKRRIAEAAAEDDDYTSSDSNSDDSGDDGSGYFLRRRTMQRPNYEGKTGGSLSAASPAVSSTSRSHTAHMSFSMTDAEDRGSEDNDGGDWPEGKRGGSIGARGAIMRGKLQLPSSLDDSDESGDSDDSGDERIRSYSERRIPSTGSTAGKKTRK